MMDYKDFMYMASKDIDSVIEYLKKIRSGFERGNISLESSSERINLIPADLFYISIKARKKNKDSKITLKLEWNEDSKQNSVPNQNSGNDKEFIREKFKRSNYNEVKIESLKDRNSIITYLNELIDGISAGSIQIKKDSDKFNLCPTKNIILNIKAKKQGIKSKLTIKLKWKENFSDSDDKLIIS